MATRVEYKAELRSTVSFAFHLLHCCLFCDNYKETLKRTMDIDSIIWKTAILVEMRKLSFNK